IPTELDGERWDDGQRVYAQVRSPSVHGDARVVGVSGDDAHPVDPIGIPRAVAILDHGARHAPAGCAAAGTAGRGARAEDQAESPVRPRTIKHAERVVRRAIRERISDVGERDRVLLPLPVEALPPGRRTLEAELRGAAAEGGPARGRELGRVDA